MSNKEIDKLLLMLLDDDSSFEKLYEQTRVIVFAYIMSLVKNYDDSKDILQETYIKIYKASSSYQSMSKPLAWIYTIARNECYLYLRRQTYTEEYQDNAVLPMYMDKDTQLILENLFEILNEKERQVIIMHSLWGFKHHEIAKLLEISISTSLSCYHRGMKKMKKEMGINL